MLCSQFLCADHTLDSNKNACSNFGSVISYEGGSVLIS